MNILIVNDDGISSKRINILRECLKKFGNVYVCVPNSERSGNSHATKKYDILEKNFFKINEEENTYVHNCTASDSIKFFLKFVRKDIDLVISGINQGFNLGTDIVYSGTVGAALEANMHGIKSIALSAKKDFDNYLFELPRLFNFLFNKFDWGKIMCLNINFPDKPIEMPFKYKVVPIAQIKRTTIGDNDYNMCRNHGYATISPLRVDLTDYENLNAIKIGG